MLGVKVFLTGPSAQRLELRGVTVARRGKRVTPSVRNVEQSSIGKPAIAPRRGLEFGGIRTGDQPNPWWSVRFDSPAAIDEVRVYNRMDAFGSLARTLQVAILDENGAWQTVGAASSSEAADRTVVLLERLTGLALHETSGADLAALRVEVVRVLAERSLEGPLTEDAEEQRLLYGVLPTGGPTTAVLLSDDEWKLLAHLLVLERLRMDTATSFRSFAAALPSRDALDRLARELNGASARLGAGELTVTRHGVREVGALRKEGDAYVALMRRVTDEFESLGVPLMMSYGTLLGVVREGDFLVHDDDIDMIFPIDATDRDDARPLIDALCDKLLERGWKIWRNESPTALNLHLTDPRTKLHVDLFPVLMRGDRARLHMEKMKLRDIDATLVLPASTLAFRGQPLQAPADPEGFLAERYGDGWSVADPYYDWPWRLAS